MAHYSRTHFRSAPHSSPRVQGAYSSVYSLRKCIACCTLSGQPLSQRGSQATTGCTATYSDPNDTGVLWFSSLGSLHTSMMFVYVESSQSFWPHSSSLITSLNNGVFVPPFTASAISSSGVGSAATAVAACCCFPPCASWLGAGGAVGSERELLLLLLLFLRVVLLHLDADLPLLDGVLPPPAMLWSVLRGLPSLPERYTHVVCSE